MSTRWLTSRSRAPRCVLLGAIALLALGPACNEEGAGGDVDSSIVDVDQGVDLGDVDLNGPDLACTPEVQSCTDLCGPVRDNCTGDTFQCGACPSGKVCDLDAHTCIVPKSTCAELGRDCGSTKNSCGQTISCTPFTCTDPTQECDPDTNKCIACQAVTCQDLGYECGQVWLGCGPESNKTDCGTCATDKNCNDALHVCEPKTGGTCGGMTPQQMCDAAKAASSVECGIITNGCGGLIDCTTVDPTHYKCRTGLTCGGAGVPNRCAPTEPPLECVVAGFDCGTLPSACGGTVSCGTCDATAGLVCNVASGQTAGTCGPACNKPQKSCAVDYVGMCGKQLDNNCWPKIDCNCASGVCSTSVSGATGSCGAVKLCSMYTDGGVGKPCSTSASSSFPKGDGTNLTCGCANAGAAPGQEVCTGIDPTTKAGSCCQRTACSGNNATVVDACTGTTLNCCVSPQIADTSGKCCTPIANPCEAAANLGMYQINVTDGCGHLVNGTGVCDCSRYAGTPDNPAAGPGNACCAPPPACAAGVCTGTTTSVCSGKMRTCTVSNCGGGVCNGGVCCTPTACPNDGLYHASFAQGCGLANKVCACAGNLATPKDAAGNPIDGAACCAKVSCPANACTTSSVHPSCDPSPGGVTSCGITCTGSKCCNGTTCTTKATCPGGNACETGLPDNCGGTINCNCVSPGTCSTSTAGVAGTCSCPPVVCNGCSPSTQTNGCGSSKDCSCTGGQVCGTANACCTPKTCADLPAGWQCGSVSNTCQGTNISCGCNTSGTTPLAVCNTSTHLCECTPKKCCKDTGGQPPSCLGPGAYGPGLSNDDGCGNSGTCSS